MNTFKSYVENLEAFSKEVEKDGCQIISIMVSSDGLSHFNYAGNITPFNAIMELYQLLDAKYNTRVAKEQFKSFYNVVIEKGDVTMGILEEINSKLDGILAALDNTSKGCDGSCHNNSFQSPVASVQTTSIKQPSNQQPVSAAPVVDSAPTVTPTYTIDQLAVAGGRLMDMGKTSDIQNLLTEFNVLSLPELPTEHYNAFALRLRELGAQI